MSASTSRSLWTRLLLRSVVAIAPPLLIAHAIFAAPPVKKPPAAAATKASTTKDAGADGASDAKGTKVEAGLKEAKPDVGVAATKGSTEDPYDIEVKESERKEGDASVKVFEFGSTEIEGRSRWPAVTYFIRRMRAEFEAQKLPHRSFFPELRATKGDPEVR